MNDPLKCSHCLKDLTDPTKPLYEVVLWTDRSKAQRYSTMVICPPCWKVLISA